MKRPDPWYARKVIDMPLEPENATVWREPRVGTIRFASGRLIRFFEDWEAVGRIAEARRES